VADAIRHLLAIDSFMIFDAACRLSMLITQADFDAMLLPRATLPPADLRLFTIAQ